MSITRSGRHPTCLAAAKNGFAVTQFGRPPVLGSNEQIFGVSGQILGRDQGD